MVTCIVSALLIIRVFPGQQSHCHGPAEKESGETKQRDIKVEHVDAEIPESCSFAFHLFKS